MALACRRILVLGIRFAVADGPTAGQVGGFVPPAIQDAEVEDAVDAGLHAAGAAGLFAAAGIVQPEVDALHQLAGHLHVVVFEEDDVLPEVGIAGILDDLADQRLAGRILGMGFAGDNDLHGPLRIAEDLLQPLDVAKDQGGALVGGEAAGESDGEGVGIEHFAGAPDLGRGSLATGGRLHLARAHETDQPALAAAMRFEQFLVRDIVHLLPDFGLDEAVAPFRLQVLIVKLREIGIQPARQVDTVGDRGNRHLPNRKLRPEVVPHFLRDGAMQAADGVAMRRKCSGPARPWRSAHRGCRDYAARAPINWSNWMPVSSQ